MLFAGSSGVGSPQPESIQHGIARDLTGNEIEFIRLNVDEISIVPFVHPQFGPRIQINASVSYEFWGTPVPEPAAILLALPLLIARRLTRRSTCRRCTGLGKCRCAKVLCC